jgi:hypothetical protein
VWHRAKRQVVVLVRSGQSYLSSNPPTKSFRARADSGQPGVLGGLGGWSFWRVVVLLVMVCCCGVVFGFVLQSTAKVVDSFRGSANSSGFTAFGS